MFGPSEEWKSRSFISLFLQYLKIPSVNLTDFSEEAADFLDFQVEFNNTPRDSELLEWAFSNSSPGLEDEQTQARALHHEFFSQMRKRENLFDFPSEKRINE